VKDWRPCVGLPAALPAALPVGLPLWAGEAEPGSEPTRRVGNTAAILRQTLAVCLPVFPCASSSLLDYPPAHKAELHRHVCNHQTLTNSCQAW
jgi:hypothetical protein